MALRDTWLPLLKAHGIPYRFFLAGTAVDDSELDSLLRRERDYFDDMVFLVGTTDKYPIGKKGLAALLWVAHHSDAQFWLKFDDDLYIRPHSILSRLSGVQRAELYWGAFDYSGLVVRDPSDPHYTPPEIWPEPVFPPYARGAALAMSMDLVRLVADHEEKRPLKKIKAQTDGVGWDTGVMVMLQTSKISISWNTFIEARFWLVSTLLWMQLFVVSLARVAFSPEGWRCLIWFLLVAADLRQGSDINNSIWSRWTSFCLGCQMLYRGKPSK